MRYRLLPILLVICGGTLADAQPVNYLTIPDWVNTAGPQVYEDKALVKFNGTVFICSNPVSPVVIGCGFGTANAPDKNHAWNALAGLQAWDSTVTYQPNTMVMRNGNLFTAIKASTNKDPANGANPDFWKARGGTPAPAIFVGPNPTTGLFTSAEINAAISAAPSGGIVQLDCVTYDVGTTPIAISKSINLQGCGGPATTGGGILGTKITGNAGTTRINITATSAVQISNLTVQGAGTEALITGGLTEGVSIRFVQLNGGGIGVDVTDSREFSLRDSIADGQSDIAVRLRGVLDPDRATVWIQNNFIVGPASPNGNTGIVLQDVSASYISGNKIINFLTCLDVVAVLAGAHSEYHITGNALTCNQQGTGTRGSVRFLTSAAAGFGNIEIVGNYLDALDFDPSHGGSQPTVVFDGTLNSISNLTFTGNAIRTGQLSGAGAVRGIGLLSATFSGNTIDFWVTPPAASVYGFNITSSSGVVVSSTTYLRDGVVTNPYQGSNYKILDIGGGVTIPKSMLDLMSPSNGSQIYCSDCTLTGNMAVCSSGGGGSMATRISGAWRCL